VSQAPAKQCQSCHACSAWPSIIVSINYTNCMQPHLHKYQAALQADLLLHQSHYEHATINLDSQESQFGDFVSQIACPTHTNLPGVIVTPRISVWSLRRITSCYCTMCTTSHADIRWRCTPMCQAVGESYTHRVNSVTAIGKSCTRCRGADRAQRLSYPRPDISKKVSVDASGVSSGRLLTT
jgi:hypothetical protein